MAHFQYTKEQFEQICEQVLDLSKKKIDISHICVEISEGTELGIDVRNQNIETLEHSQSQNISITIYKGQKIGHASSGDFSKKSLESIIDAAFHIATYTSEDPNSGLPNQEDLATDIIDCDIYHPWDIETKDAIEIAKNMESALYENKGITNSEGCSVSTDSGHFILANSMGFMHGYQYSRHAVSASAIAGKNDKMQSDSWHSDKRCAKDLDDPVNVARIAAQRAVAKIGAKKISTRVCPIVFEAPIAKTLIRGMLAALTGSAQYQKNSFLLDSIGQRILPEFLSLYEDPFILKGISSSPFDEDGVKVNSSYIIKDGLIQQYLLNTYSAKKLNLPNNGHAGGNHNLHLEYNPTANGKIFTDLDALLKNMDTGLLVTDLMGQGLNITNGNYSKGASGFWIEKGIIAYPVEEITIAGNLKDMLQNIAGISIDEHVSSIINGSILLDNMTISGS